LCARISCSAVYDSRSARHVSAIIGGSAQRSVMTLSLTQKRALAAIYLAVLIVCASSYSLGWHLFGGADRRVLAVVTLVGPLAAARYGPELLEELRECRRRQGPA
jgi:hypothetical protein